MRNMNPSKTMLLQLVQKPLPFRCSGWKPYVVSDWRRICSAIAKSESLGKEIIIIDDFQYLMADEFMNRATETGFQKFTEICLHAYQVIKSAINAPKNLRVYFLSHTETGEMGKIKCKTIGKMLDEKITLEGLFTIVLRTHVENNSYTFSTQNNGNDTVKSPMGLFSSTQIENDLNAIDDIICQYYEIGVI